MNKHLLLLIALFFIFYGTAQADFYKWEDENGGINITDNPPPAKSGKKIQVHKYESPVQEEDDKQEITEKAPAVVLYTKESCADCDKAREFLKSKKIHFTEYNTDTSKEAAKKRKKLDDSNETPFAIINNNQVYGFSETIYNRVLKVKP